MMYFFAIVAGGMVVFSMVMNSQLARSIGTFQGTFINFAVGLITSFLLLCLSSALGTDALDKNMIPPPWYAYFGAFLGIGVVASCNIVIPKIPVVYSAVLIFLGQIVAGLILDTVFSGFFDHYKAIGATLIAGGLLINARIDAEQGRRA